MKQPLPYQVSRLPWNSATTADIMHAGRMRHHVQGLVEIDVTVGRPVPQNRNPPPGRVAPRPDLSYRSHSIP